TTARSASAGPIGRDGVLALLATILAALGILRVRHLRLPPPARRAILVGAGLALAACGGGGRAGPTPDAAPPADATEGSDASEPPPGHTYELTVTGTSSGQTRTLALWLTVQGP